MNISTLRACISEYMPYIWAYVVLLVEKTGYTYIALHSILVLVRSSFQSFLLLISS